MIWVKKIVSYQVSKRNDNQLVFNTFDKALKSDNPEGIIFHSDRGFQYTGKISKEKSLKQK